MSSTSRQAPDRFQNRVLRHSTEIVILLIAAWIGFRIYAADISGKAMADRERRAVEIMRAIHAGEQSAIAGTLGRMAWLSELVEKAPADTVLRKLTAVDAMPVQGVEVFKSRDYYFALYLVDPDLDDTRAFSRAMAKSSEVGKRGYGAFAWPVNYSDGSQWAFAIDHRGRLLGSWNHKATLDGFKAPFPPTANPLKDYNQAVRDSGDSEWFLFDDLGAIAEQ